LAARPFVISTVLFDLDGTLYDRDRLVRSLAAEQYRKFQTELQHVGQARYVERLIELDDHGYQPKRDVYATLAREYGLSPALERELESHFWSDYDRFCDLTQDTASTLGTLRDVGKRLGIITNGTAERQHAKIDALGIRSLFDVIIVSEEIGLRKPDPRIFDRALERCGSVHGEAVFVGDHPEADIEGAANAGLRAVWKSVPYWRLNRPDIPRINQLSELLTVLELDSQGKAEARLGSSRPEEI
jgi:putative hydrolase of the HAD superfamily